MKKMTMSEAGHIGGQRTKIFWQNKYLENPRFCKHCSLKIDFEKRNNAFCNSSCAASFNNQGVVRNTHGLKLSKIKEKKECLNCGKKTRNDKYCSRKCHRQCDWKKYCLKIEETGSLIPTNTLYGYSPRIAKRYLKEKRGNCCEICKGTEWNGQPMPLVLDHINGNPENHSLSNVRLVCGNCNMLLPTFAGGNKGKGRKSRKNLYWT